MIRNRDDLARTERHEVALRALTAGIEAAHPRQVVDEHVERDGGGLVVCGERYDRDQGDLLVLGGGKPAGAMATALVDCLGDAVDGGLVVAEAGDGELPDTGPIEQRTGAHPVPSEANVEATSALLELAGEASADDLVLAVVGGGASALLCAPPGGLSLAGVQQVTGELLDSPATIGEINTVRRQLSTVKGGRLAERLAPAQTVGLLLSDVAGDDPGVIGSGPTVPTEPAPGAALAVLDRYGISVPAPVSETLSEPPEPATDPPVSNHVLAGGERALGAAAEVCAEAGHETAVLAPEIEGAAAEVGRLHATVGRSCRASGKPFEPPVALLSGGETTVTVTGDGQGGPNQATGLAAALDLATGDAGGDVVVASVDTDGIDGPTDAAGALVDGTTVANRERGRQALDGDDAYPYLAAQDALVETGPTGTNVNDLRVVLVGRA